MVNPKWAVSAAYHRARRPALAAAGLCTWGCGFKAAPNRKLCPACLAKARKRAAAYYAKHRERLRLARRAVVSSPDQC